jgi:hypothetical protein
LESRKRETEARLESLQRSLLSNRGALENLVVEEKAATSAQKSLEARLSTHEEQVRELENQRRVNLETQAALKKETEEYSAQINRLNLEK